MVRLYLKKMVYSLSFLILYFVVFLMVIAYIWGRIEPSLVSFLGTDIHPNLSYCLILAIALVLELVGVYFLRIDNPRYSEAYLKINKGQRYKFSKDFVATLKSSENLLHTSAFLTVTTPVIFYVSLASEAPMVFLILGTLIFFLVQCFFFMLINTLIWCIVHKQWLNPKKPIDFEKLWNAIINRLKGLS